MCYFAGLDFGTSGARICVIDAQGAISFSGATPYVLSDAATWRGSLFELITSIPLQQRRALQNIAISGTSATTLLTTASGAIASGPLLYNDARSVEEANWLYPLAPPQSVAAAPTSSLSKLAWFSKQKDFAAARYVAHQADWLAMQLHGRPGLCDYHNALKLGYDLQQLTWPAWVTGLPFASMLPEVQAPGELVAEIIPALATQLQVNPACVIRAGTTDSNAAFFASGACMPGEAVTSLGSTLVLKIISAVHVENAQHGIYSHRFGDNWLIGGASNSGGAVLKTYFSDAKLNALSLRIDPSMPAPYRYYPLTAPGERFPTNDPRLPPLLSPRPGSDTLFLHCLLEGIAHIEAQGYALLETLSGNSPSIIFSAGRGALNPVYHQIRQRVIGHKIVVAPYTEAAYGAALLARDGTQIFDPH